MNRHNLHPNGQFRINARIPPQWNQHGRTRTGCTKQGQTPPQSHCAASYISRVWFPLFQLQPCTNIQKTDKFHRNFVWLDSNSVHIWVFRLTNFASSISSNFRRRAVTASTKLCISTLMDSNNGQLGKLFQQLVWIRSTPSTEKRHLFGVQFYC